MFIIVNKTFPKAGKESFEKVTLVYFFVIMFLAKGQPLIQFSMIMTELIRGMTGKSTFELRHKAFSYNYWWLACNILSIKQHHLSKLKGCGE